MTPTEEELFKKYNPDLQKKSLANRDQTQHEFNEFVAKLKEYSQSDKPSEYQLFLSGPGQKEEGGTKLAQGDGPELRIC